MSQLLNWCGHDFDGVIVLDECHKAKNLVPTGSSKPTKTGLAVLELQNKLPKAIVVYCSATELGAHGEAVNDVNVEHGMSWEESLDLRTTKTYPENGYLSNQWLEAKEKLDQGAELMCAGGRAKKTIWGQFWSAEQVQRMSVCHWPVTGTQNTEHNWCRLFSTSFLSSPIWRLLRIKILVAIAPY
ncbi:PREDICTED: protein strawberry notch homolog 1-like isoform X2 [Acropora digitifera]|uniref:protein strawberry notch homolog 1-like isoform X2 n=1 Tax=Acropora digitifera TaxID=70779 RepID=UPI000779FBFF|nr:PREDICTED: protein strawberry notch homolog 1-like isoform X2 [Acropora digitifera]